MQTAMAEMLEHCRTHQSFAEVGTAMIEQWESGIERSLTKG